ncbi:MAG: TauD/TfdA family dioxygenase [Pseudomonadota bacterium]
MKLEIEPLSYGVGAEIKNVDLSEPLSADLAAAIKKAWNDHHVILLRGQDITPQQHLAFTQALGPTEPYPLFHYRHPDVPEIFLLSNMKTGEKRSETADAGRAWHADLSYTTNPAVGSILRCLKTPDVGGNTMFANQHMAFDRLSPAYQKMIDGMEAVHQLFAKTKNLDKLNQKEVADLKAAYPPVVQPMVRTHPENGRKALYVSWANTIRIMGMTEEESRGILEYLFEHQVTVEFTYRHAWKPNDILMWDNRSVLHMAVADNDHVQDRLMHRTTVIGDKSGRLLEPKPELAA